MHGSRLEASTITGPVRIQVRKGAKAIICEFYCLNKNVFVANIESGKLSENAQKYT
jgi:hypothetical protein